jgi:heme-degrading monooxygenase HmoA
VHARTNTLTGDPQALDEGIAYIRDEMMPLLQQRDGFVGLSMLCDRDSGRCVVTTAWADEEAMHASEAGVAAGRERTAHILGGSAPEVREWEIAVLHRMHDGHDGACARVLWGEIDPAEAEDALSTFRMTMMPRMADLPGFCSVSLLVDRATGRSAMTTCYDSREDMARAAGIATSMREEFSSAMGVTLTDMAEFDVVLHHLRVPETV